MKNKKTLKIIIICLVIVTLLLVKPIYAKSTLESQFKTLEYSEDFKKWLTLSEKEKNKTIQPKLYDINSKTSNKEYLKNISNILKTAQLLGATALDKYNLKDDIANNVKIRNQMTTQACWAFASIGALETNLALQDKKNNKTSIEYDYSERHLDYSTTRNAFLNNAINEKGFTRDITKGGNLNLANAYFTNGSGAVTETEMPFVNDQTAIDISQINNKTVATTVSDIVEFPILSDTATESERTDLITKMKEHITNYGGIYTAIHGAQLLSDYYNNETGAMYCDSKDINLINHAVTLIGWDDSYGIENFNPKHKPTKEGAWIVKNSWGESIKQNLDEIKEKILTAYAEECRGKGWTTKDQLTNEYVKEKLIAQGYGEEQITITDTEVSITVGNNGYMYVSYEDATIYKSLYGIEKSSASKDYYNIYQNDYLGMSAAIGTTSSENVYIANIFKRNSNTKEALDKISIYTPGNYTCKVLVNPNGSSKNPNDLQEVQLQAGETESFGAGYHTIEFAKPVKLTGDTFVVVVEVTGGSKEVALEYNLPDSYWADAIVNEGESFITTETAFKAGEWIDTAKKTETISKPGNTCIKAFTQQDNTPDPDPNPNPDPDPDIQNPTSSNFKQSTANMTEAKIYFDSTNLDNSYIKLKIKVSNIKIGNEKNKYTYYYYLSGKQGETDIAEGYWTKATAQKESDGTYSITIDLNTKDIKNIEEISESENLYIYIKEIAEIDNQTKQTINTIQVGNQATPTIYVDGTEIGNLDDYFDQIFGEYTPQLSGKTEKEDGTVADKKLPQTGMISLIIATGFILIIGGYSYIKYKNIDK